MQSRSLSFLASATGVLVAIAIVVLVSGDRGVSRAAPGQPAFPTLAAKLGEVASVTVSRNGTTMTLIRDGDSWLVAEKGNYPANTANISQIVRAMADLTLVEPKTQNPDLYPRLEVEDPDNGKPALPAVKDKSGGALDTLDLHDVKPAAELPVPDKDVVSASFTTFDGLTVDLRLIERDKTDWVAIAATGSGSAEAEAKKIEDKVSHWTYAIPAYKANLLKTKLADLVEPPKGS